MVGGNLCGTERERHREIGRRGQREREGKRGIEFKEVVQVIMG